MVGKEALLFDDLSASGAELNEVVNQLRDEVRAWRAARYPGTAGVTRRLLEWWFERDEERRAVGRRFFFCQQEAVETVSYLYEVQNRRKLPETGDLLRYALKLATGTGKTVVMALFVTGATLHKRKVSGSSLSANFLVLVPNLTVRDRVSGVPRGDGLDPQAVPRAMQRRARQDPKAPCSSGWSRTSPSMTPSSPGWSRSCGCRTPTSMAGCTSICGTWCRAPGPRRNTCVPARAPSRPSTRRGKRTMTTGPARSHSPADRRPSSCA